MNDAAREVGGALGIAVLGSILNTVYRADVSAALPDGLSAQSLPAQDSLPAALAAAGHLGDSGAGLAAAASDAFTHGMTVAFLASAGLLLVVATALAVINRTGSPEPDSQAGPTPTWSLRRSPGAVLGAVRIPHRADVAHALVGRLVRARRHRQKAAQLIH